MQRNICRFYIEGHCKKGDECNFEHVDNVCRNWFSRGHCRHGQNCRFQHIDGERRDRRDRRNNRRPRIKNTETFEPSHEQPDMRVIVASGKDGRYKRTYVSNDVIIINDLFCEESDLTIYNKLLEEMKNSGVNPDELWKLWHGDTHLIADDKKDWKKMCPTFNLVIGKIMDYFNMDIKATRFNWYRNSQEWKPFHHDAAAIKPDKAKVQNLTVGVSFGAEREAAFQHAKTRNVISFPLPNGSIYVFSKDVNIEWRHGILQLPPEKQHGQGRISIIAWGAVEMESKNN